DRVEPNTEEQRHRDCTEICTRRLYEISKNEERQTQKSDRLRRVSCRRCRALRGAATSTGPGDYSAALGHGVHQSREGHDKETLAQKLSSCNSASAHRRRVSGLGDWYH